MSVPDWWEAVLLALAAWRVFQLISEDEILDRPRRYVTGKISPYWEDFITCPYCAGFWITFLWWGAWQIWDHGTLVLASLFAIHAGMIGAYKILASE